MFHDLSRRLPALGLIAAATLPLAACGSDGNFGSRGLEAQHQPVVSYATFLYDIRAEDGTRLSPAEQTRLVGWLDSLNVGYGDNLAISTQGDALSPEMKQDIADVLGRRGMLIGLDGSPIAGTPPAGSIRLILRRASASVPGCPDWRSRQESTLSEGTSSNFGCGVNSNLAAMVANPEDLVRGQTSDSDLVTATSDRAIKTYREKAPTGAGGLKSISATGN